MATRNIKLEIPAGRYLFAAIFAASCLLSGVIRADDAGPVQEVDLKTFLRQIDLEKVPYDERDFYLGLRLDGMTFLDSRVHTSSLESDAQMLVAIQQGDVVSLKDVLEHGVAPTQFDPDRIGHNPVYWAVYFNRPDMVKLLLDHMAEGWMCPKNESPLQLAQRLHPEMIPILREGIKRDRLILSARLADNLHAAHIDVPAFSHASFQDVIHFLIGAMNQAHVGYLERSVGVASTFPTSGPYPPQTTTPAMCNVTIWNALQTIADADHLKFVASEKDVTFYSSSFPEPKWDP